MKTSTKIYVVEESSY